MRPSNPGVTNLILFLQHQSVYKTLRANVAIGQAADV